MSFWGTEVKPGKPFTHSIHKACGRLRISQATLGIGVSTKKSMVQCNVGNKSPVLLCSLLPDKTESCHLDLEFEEVDDVVFSVVGPRSVHLTGFYLGSKHRHSNPDDESDTYGEEIGETDTEHSGQHSDEDEYEDSFINDDDIEVTPPSPIVSDEGMPDREMSKNEKSHRRRLKKCNLTKPKDSEFLFQENITKHRRSAQIVESDDEDQMPFSSLLSDGKVIQHCRSRDGRVDDAGKKRPGGEGGDADKSNKRNKASAAQDSERVDDQTYNTSLDIDDKVHDTLAEEKKVVKEKMRKAKSSQIVYAYCSDVCGDQMLVDEAKNDRMMQDVPGQSKQKQDRETKKRDDETYKSILGSSEGLKTKNKSKKKKDKKGNENIEVSANRSDVCQDDREQVNEAERDKTVEPAISTSTDGPHDLFLASEEGHEIATKPKKKEKSKKAKAVAAATANLNDVCEEGGQVKAQAIKMEQDRLPDSQQKMELGMNGKYSKREDPGSTVEESQSDGKSGRKRKKIKGNTVTASLLETRAANTDVRLTRSRTSSEDLVVEELEVGRPNGKVSSAGKKVTILYAAKLKEGGRVFDSNIGGDPFKLRLGEGQLVKGLDVGLEGMREGGRRRIKIPPHLGYGSDGLGESVPPNAWLIYDVELVRVR